MFKFYLNFIFIIYFYNTFKLFKNMKISKLFYTLLSSKLDLQIKLNKFFKFLWYFFIEFLSENQEYLSKKKKNYFSKKKIKSIFSKYFNK
jgi:hypothetical protein